MTSLLWILLSLGSFVHVRADCPACDDLRNGRVPRGFTELTYSESGEHIENPGRGFNRYTLTTASDFRPLTKSALDAMRAESGITLVWRQYLLDDFVTSDLSDDFLAAVAGDMDVLRAAGFAAYVRFMYTNTYVTVAPYGDATKAQMLRHIGQVAPLLRDNSDVITALHAGFIGIWGEWYYTTELGDPNDRDWSVPGNFLGYTPQVWADRTEVMQALLDAAPKDMMVQFRYPAQKYHGLGDDAPTTEAEMEAQTDKARTSHHNDCFVSSDTDVGTYWNKTWEYAYLEQDTRWTTVSGETCSLTENGRHLCPTATKELAELHWNSLNELYNQDVYDTWRRDGCYADIHRRLGYRIVLTKAVLPDSLPLGGRFCLHLELENAGYAAPTRQRDVAVLLRRQDGGALFSAALPDVNLRTWLPGRTVSLDRQLAVPDSLPDGRYQVLLSITDPDLSHLSDYNVLLANTDVPLYREGLNDLGHSVQTTEGSGFEPSCPVFEEYTAPRESEYDRLYCGLGGC